MAAKQQSFMGKIYPTQRSLEDHFRQTISSYRRKTPLQGADHEFMMAVLGRHHDVESKTGPGVRHFEIRRSKRNSRASEAWIVWVDGREIDFSWLGCAADPIPASLKKRVYSALRHAIRPDMLEFRREIFASDSTPKCAISAVALLDDLTTHVDHTGVEFRGLADAWVAKLGGLEIVALRDDPSSGTTRVMDDAGQEKSWIDFHRKNAELQLTTDKSNLEKIKPRIQRMDEAA